MRVWILKASEPTLWDHDRRGTRRGRYSLLCEALAEAGHEVLWWTDDFDHFQHRHRFGEDHCEEVRPGIAVSWVHTPGYARNMSHARFQDHKRLAKRVEGLAGKHPRPDLVLAGLPTDWFCILATKLAARYEVPSVLDVRDLWPDVFFGRVPLWARPLLWLYTRPMARRIRRAFRNATAIAANTPGFLEWGLAKGGRRRSRLDGHFPIGQSARRPQPPALARAYQWWAAEGVEPSESALRVCFFGTLGPMYQFGSILQAASDLSSAGLPVQFVLCGKGPLLRRLQAEALRRGNLKVPGWVDHTKVWALMEMSDVGLAPYVADRNFALNMPNKIAEFASASLLIMVSVQGYVSEMLSRYAAGVVYHTGGDLAAKLRELCENRALLATARRGSYKLFKEVLDAQNIYPRYVRHLEVIGGADGESDVACCDLCASS